MSVFLKVDKCRGKEGVGKLGGGRGCLSENYNEISCKTKKEKTNKAENLRQAEITA